MIIRTARVKARWMLSQEATVRFPPDISFDVASLCVVGLGRIGPDWVMEQTKERLRRELEADEREYEERLRKARKREAAAKKAALARVRKKPVSLTLFVLCGVSD